MDAIKKNQYCSLDHGQCLPLHQKILVHLDILVIEKLCGCAISKLCATTIFDEVSYCYNVQENAIKKFYECTRLCMHVFNVFEQNRLLDKLKKTFL